MTSASTTGGGIRAQRQRRQRRDFMIIAELKCSLSPACQLGATTTNKQVHSGRAFVVGRAREHVPHGARGVL